MATFTEEAKKQLRMGVPSAGKGIDSYSVDPNALGIIEDRTVAPTAAVATINDPTVTVNDKKAAPAPGGAEAITGTANTGATAANPLGTPAPTTGPAAGNTTSGGTEADYTYRQSLNNIFRDQSQLDSDAKLQADRLKSGTETALQEAESNYKKALESSKEYFGDTGTLRSGINLKKQGDIGTDFAKDSQSQITNAQKQLEDLARETVSRKQALELQRQQAELDQARAREQADLQKALIQAQNEAYAAMRSNLLGGTVVTPTSSAGTTGTAFQVDPATGGTLVDGNGNPVTSASVAQQLLAQRDSQKQQVNQPVTDSSKPWGTWTPDGYV